MGALFGPLGGLDELPCATSLSESPTGSVVLSETRALDGTVSAQVAPESPNRAWDVQVGTASPEQAQILAQATRYQRRRARPHIFYSESAQLNNLLDPDASLMSPARWTDLTEGGSRVRPFDEPGLFLESGATRQDGTWAHLSNIPIPYGRTVTVSIVLTAYPGQTAHLWIDELGMDGATLPDVRKLTTTGTLQRLSTTFETTGSTVALTLGVSRALTVVAPQVTLTDRVMSWSEGEGCLNAYMTPASREVQAAFMAPNDYGRRSAYAWQVREIGKASMGHAG